MVRALVLLLLLAVAGCPGSKSRPRIPGAVWLAYIKIEGNKSIDKDDLIPGLALDRLRREGRPVDPYQLVLDTRRIRGEYFRQGFFDAKIDSKIIRNDNAETVVFTVIEGPRMKARVAITGLPPEIPIDYVLGKLELKEGAPFVYELYEEGRDIVKATVEEYGYPHVVDDSVVTVDREAGTANATYRLESGPRAKFGAITIDGVEKDGDLERAIRARLAMREGDVYTPQALAETTRSLYEMGRFSQVRIDIEREIVSPTVPIKIRVTIAGRVELRAGGGFGLEPLTYETRVRAGFSYVPIDYPLQTYSVDARIAAAFGRDAIESGGTFDYEPKVRVLFNVQRLDFLRPKLVADVGGGVDFFTVEAYTAAGGVLRAGLSFPLIGRWLTAQVGWALSYLTFSGLATPLVRNDTNLDGVIDNLDSTQCRECDRDRRELGLAENEVNGRYEQAIVADLRDNPLEPRKGMYYALRVTEGTIAAGGTNTYLQLQSDFRAYYPLGRIVFAYRLRGGTIFGDVPITQRFFSGGAQNHRGFSARSLAPAVDRFNDNGVLVGSIAIGGQAFVETGVEARIPIGTFLGFLWGTTLFLDGGDVVFDQSEVDANNLHWAAGLGIFAKYGGFKIRVDVGKRLNRYTVDAAGNVKDGFFENTNFFLAVGETF